MLPIPRQVRLAMLTAILLSIAACTSKGDETWLGIRNNTGYEITFTVYPSQANQHYGAGKFTIPDGSDESFLWLEGYKDDPANIASSIYDSICISINAPDSLKLYFDHTKAINYLINPFFDSKGWKIRNFTFSEPTEFHRHKNSVREYFFEINKDSLVNLH